MLVARNADLADVATTSESVPEPIVSLVADGAAGTVPDLQGLSAREAIRALIKLGLTARVSGDGFVVSQQPAAGAPIEPGAVCRLVLDRSSAHTRANASQP